MKIFAIVTASLLAALPAAAQKGQERSLSCSEHGFNQSHMVTHCEMREQTLGFAGRLSIDPGTNGGVSIKGSDRGDVLVRAKVEAAGDDEMAAKAVASQIRLNLSAGQITTMGPEQGRGGWSVSYEIFVPKNGDVSVKTYNGGISISDVRGRIQFDAMNGGVNLKRLAGDVEGTTMNGGLNIELVGDRWDGTKLDARTTNGGVNVTMPERYSAQLETSTVNGRMNIDMPITVHGEIGKRLSTTLGSGGPLVHIETTNGGVNIKRPTM